MKNELLREYSPLPSLSLNLFFWAEEVTRSIAVRCKMTTLGMVSETCTFNLKIASLFALLPGLSRSVATKSKSREAEDLCCV